MRHIKEKTFLKKFIVFLIAGIFYSCNHNATDTSRQIINLDSDWKFITDSIHSNLYEKDLNDNTWETVYLPHTPHIEPLIVNNQWQGIAWYRKHLKIDENTEGKKIFLKFEGAMEIADVWVNNKHKMTHYGGYLPFMIDISNELNPGDNIIAVKLDNKDHSDIPPGKPLKELDFNTYGGIYRDVKLIITDKLYITDPVYVNQPAKGGVFVSFDSITKSSAEINIKTHVKNDYPEEITFKIIHILFNKNNDPVAKYISENIHLEPNNNNEFHHKLKVHQPFLWHPDHPDLYTLKTILYRDNSKVDAVETRLGIKNIELKPDGFFINGKKLFIRGTNRHQEYPYIGYALSDEAQYRDAVKIKNAGFQFVRLSHYPQSESFLNACDELGLMVMDCIPGWQFMGNDTFRKNSLNDCRNMIRRDRNHPSVVFWEVSLNETPMDKAYMNKANKILDEEFSQKAISAGWIDNELYDLFIPARQHATPPDYWNFYRTGERPLFIAEYGDWEYYAQDAGFNQPGFNHLKPEERSSRQLRGYGEKRLLQQALNFQEAVNSNRKGKSTIGHANWLMFDYNRGYADDIEASGISDIFRIPKFAYYFFQSQRSPVKTQIKGVESGPMVYIASNWQLQSSSDVIIFSNCEEVALYLNNEIIEKRKPDENDRTTHLAHPPFTFSLKKFRKGKLKAVGYLNGKEVVVDEVSTPGKPVSVKLSFDESNMPVSRKGIDYVFVYAKIMDANGNICPVNDISVKFEPEGNADIIGGNIQKTEAGIATILLKTYPDAKGITINAEVEDFKNVVLKIW